MALESLLVQVTEKLRFKDVFYERTALDEMNQRLVEKLSDAELQQRLESVRLDSEVRIMTDVEFQARMSDLATPEGLQELATHHPNIEQKLEKLQTDVAGAEGPRDLQRVDIELQQYRGTVAEQMVEASLADAFEAVEQTQRVVETSSGFTRPDVELKHAQKTIELGELVVHPGEDLTIEVKTGSAEYLEREFAHILQQVEGHGDNSLVVFSEEYHQIAPEVRAGFENELAEHGSHVVVLDIETKTIDNALRSLIVPR